MPWPCWGRLLQWGRLLLLIPWPRWGRLAQRSALFLSLLLLPFSKAAVEITFGLLLIGWLIEHGATRWRESVWASRSSRPCLVALVGFLVVCALSIVTSTYPGNSLNGFINKTLEYALMLVIAADVAKDRLVVQRGLAILMVSSLFVGLDAVAQEIFGKEPLFGYVVTNYGRMGGPYNNPSDLATYLIVVIPIVIVQMAVVSGRKRWALGALLALLVGCVIRTESRGAWLGLLGSLAVLGVVSRRLGRPLLIAGLSVAVCGGLFLQMIGRLHQVALDPGTRDRVLMWQSAYKMIQDRPVLGQGLNTFMANYLKYRVGGEQQPRYAHNCFLQVAAETGLLGLATFLWWLGSMTWLWWRAFRSLTPQDPSRSALLGVASGLIGFLIQSAFDTNFYSLRQAALFWTLAGLATGLAVMTLGKPARQEDV